MKTLIGMALALSLLMGTFANVAAQHAETPVVAGIDETITWIDEDGSAVATVQVTKVNGDFTDYPAEMPPEYGYRYQAISFTVENVSDRSIIIERGMFTTITDQGRVATEQYMEPTDDSITMFTDDVPLAAGESAELTSIYVTPEFSHLALFRWNLDNGAALYIYLAPEARDQSAVASGLSTPATYFDDFGNPVASVEVTGVNPNWAAYADFSEPDEGRSYVAVHVTATNLTHRPVIVRSQHFRMVNETGLVQRPSYASAREDARGPLSDDAVIEPGESMDFYVVFDSTPESVVIAVQWAPNWSDVMFVMLNSDESATPEATPAG